MDDLSRPVPPPPGALLSATRRLARPLVRLLIQAGVTFPVLADLLRGLYVEVALTDLLRDEKARTDSRVSLLTGVHRKEIRRLRQLPHDTDPIPPAVTLGSQVIARWLTRPDTTAADGSPLPLPRLPRLGGGLSFDELVESVTTDVRPRTVLDDWRDQGIATLDEQDTVRLNSAAFLPRGGGKAQLFYFARNLHDHIAAAAANVSASGEAPFADRSVHYDALDEATARALEQIARAAAQKALLEVNKAALAMLDAAPHAATATPDRKMPVTTRVNFGIYVYRDSDSGGPEGT
jgi:hypothetical protein